MFDKKIFQHILISARGNRTNEDYSKDSNVSRAYISNYINMKRDTPPTPDILKKLASNASNNICYEDLMRAAGYLETEEKKPSFLLNTKLISLRNEKDLSQQELAKLVGISVDDIDAFEQGIKKPDPQVLNRLCEVFNVTLDYLLGRADKDQESPITGLDKEIVRLIKEADDKDKVKMLLKASNGISKENVEKAIRIMEALGED